MHPSILHTEPWTSKQKKSNPTWLRGKATLVFVLLKLAYCKVFIKSHNKKITHIFVLTKSNYIKFLFPYQPAVTTTTFPLSTYCKSALASLQITPLIWSTHTEISPGPHWHWEQLLRLHGQRLSRWSLSALKHRSSSNENILPLNNQGSAAGGNQ